MYLSDQHYLSGPRMSKNNSRLIFILISPGRRQIVGNLCFVWRRNHPVQGQIRNYAGRKIRKLTSPHLSRAY